MKKVNFFVMAIVIISIAIISCSKKKDDAVIPDNSGLTGIPKIKTSTNDNGKIVNTFQYDGNGRLSKYEATETGKLVFTVTYEYSTSTVIEKWLRPNETDEIDTWTLNDKGQGILLVRTGVDPVTDAFTYDSNGFSKGDQGSKDTITVTNGNIVKRVGYGRSEVIEYYLDKINTIGLKNIGLGYRGSDNKNLEKTITSGSNVGTNTYTFDSKGRVITKTATWGGSRPSTDVSTYTYTD